MDPATVAAISTLLGLVKEYGITAVVLIAGFILIRSWQRGDFLSRKQHEDVVKMHDQRHLDMAQRVKEALDERDEWKAIAERATDAAEQANAAALAAQKEHGGIIGTLSEIRATIVARSLPSNRRGV